MALFPALTLEVYSRCGQGNYLINGTISAGGTDLHDDEEAVQKFIAFMKADHSDGPVAFSIGYGPGGLDIQKS